MFASGGEGVRGIARPIIGHDPFDGDAEASVAGERGFQVGDGAACFLIGEHACMDAGGRAASGTSRRAPRGFSRFEVFESRQAGPFQHPADGGGGHADRLGDRPASQPLTPQGDNPLDGPGWGGWKGSPLWRLRDENQERPQRL